AAGGGGDVVGEQRTRHAQGSAVEPDGRAAVRGVGDKEAVAHRDIAQREDRAAIVARAVAGKPAEVAGHCAETEDCAAVVGHGCTAGKGREDGFYVRVSIPIDTAAAAKVAVLECQVTEFECYVGLYQKDLAQVFTVQCNPPVAIYHGVLGDDIRVGDDGVRGRATVELHHAATVERDL